MYAHKFINLDARDRHMHTSDFSDGLQTVEELAQHAGKIGLKEIAITDHSDVCVAMFRKKYKFMSGPSSRWTTRARRNVHNDVEVIW
jgi:histidinol phosphatase-like PHP family hydrolase